MEVLVLLYTRLAHCSVLLFYIHHIYIHDIVTFTTLLPEGAGGGFGFALHSTGTLFCPMVSHSPHLHTGYSYLEVLEAVLVSLYTRLAHCSVQWSHIHDI